MRPGYRHNADISIDYEQTDGTTTDDDADANYQYDILRDEAGYWFGRSRSPPRTSEALEQVYAGGGGLGRDFTPTDDITFSLQGGPALMYYEYLGQDWQAAAWG